VSVCFITEATEKGKNSFQVPKGFKTMAVEKSEVREKKRESKRQGNRVCLSFLDPGQSR
jgi:hypothetical protein